MSFGIWNLWKIVDMLPDGGNERRQQTNSWQHQLTSSSSQHDLWTPQRERLTTTAERTQKQRTYFLCDTFAALCARRRSPIWTGTITWQNTLDVAQNQNDGANTNQKTWKRFSDDDTKTLKDRNVRRSYPRKHTATRPIVTNQTSENHQLFNAPGSKSQISEIQNSTTQDFILKTRFG